MLKNKNKFVLVLFYCTIAIIILLGLYIRISFYLAKVPMWVDEIMLASSFTDRTLTDIFTPLDAYQKVPPLFYAFVIATTKRFGINELSLRFLPFISGILSLFAVSFLLKSYIKNKAGIIVGLCLFTFCIPLIYFSAEFKPYGCDVFFCIILLLIYEHINLTNINAKQAIVYSLCTMLMIFSSFPTIFIIPAIIVSKGIKERKIDLKIFWIIAVIVISGLLLFLYDYNTYKFLHGYWNKVENGFMIIPILSFLWNYVCEACKYYIYNFNISLTACILFLSIIGAFILFKDKKEKFVLIFFIIFFTIIASSLNVYPLKPKLTLFLLPVFIILLSKVFDIQIYIKKVYYKAFLNILLITGFISFIGINIPYINLNENQLVYYNKAVQSRNKSLDDRTYVKKYCETVLKLYTPNEQILTSEEFRYSIKYYKSYYNIQKNLQIFSYADIASRKLNKKEMENIVIDFIKTNTAQKNSFWIFGRDNEGYFQCPDSDSVKLILKKYKLNYKLFQHNDLYLMYIK